MPGQEDPNPDNQPKEWMNNLPEDMRSDKNLSKFDDITALAKSYGELSSKLGNSVNLLGNEPTPEEINSFYSKLGRPESVDGYELAQHEVPEGLEIGEDQIKAFKQVAFDIGLTPNQTNAVYKAIGDQRVNDYNRHMKTLENAKVEVQQALDKKWGDKAEANREIMNRAYKHFAGDQSLDEFLKVTGADSSIGLQEMFYNIGVAMSEDRFITGDHGGKKQAFTTFDFPGLD